MLSLIPLKIKIVVGGLLIIIFIMAVALSLSPTPEPQQPPPQPTTRPSLPERIPAEEPNYTGPKPGSVSQTPLPEYEEAVKINELNGLLLKKLPYTGNDFSLKYDGTMNAFIATYRQGSEQQGKSELLAFLQANDIENTDWLINFTEIQ